MVYKKERREKKREGSDGFHEYKFKCGFIIFISNLFHSAPGHAQMSSKENGW